MAPSNIETKGVDWTTAKKICNQQEIERLACMLLNSQEVSNIDWTAAAAQWGADVKPESYKTFISRLFKKIREAKANGTANGDDASSAAAAPAKGKGKKRKAATPANGAADDENDDEEKPAAKKTKGKSAGGKKGKKATTPGVEHDADAENGIKAEEEDDFN